mgnify:CR=1 FL=1
MTKVNERPNVFIFYKLNRKWKEIRYHHDSENGKKIQISNVEETKKQM